MTARICKSGCTLFVKLRQFAADDGKRVLIDTNTAAWQAGKTDAYSDMLLHEHGAERTYLIKWHAGKSFPLHIHRGGEEIFIVAGTYADEHGIYRKGTWVRAPVGSSHAPLPTEGALLYAKLGHLPGTYSPAATIMS